MMQISTATVAELVAFFNANTGGNPVKKFADRKTAERRVQALIDEMAEDGDVPSGFIPAPGHAHDENDDGDLTKPEAAPLISRLMQQYGTETCPHCGIDLHNGVGQHLQEVNGQYIKHDQFQYECLGCGREFGPAIQKRRAVVPTGKQRPAMAQSLKLDRRIVCVTNGQVYANACQVWKAGLVSASQGDRLSSVLYGAAKSGNRLMNITINNNVFCLVA